MLFDASWPCQMVPRASVLALINERTRPLEEAHSSMVVLRTSSACSVHRFSVSAILPSKVQINSTFAHMCAFTLEKFPAS